MEIRVIWHEYDFLVFHPGFKKNKKYKEHMLTLVNQKNSEKYKEENK